MTSLSFFSLFLLTPVIFAHSFSQTSDVLTSSNCAYDDSITFACDDYSCPENNVTTIGGHRVDPKRIKFIVSIFNEYIITATTSCEHLSHHQDCTYVDTENNFGKYRARYFDTNLGRFISRDPLGYVDGMGLYNGYFGGLFTVDPFGLNEESPRARKCECGEEHEETKRILLPDILKMYKDKYKEIREGRYIIDGEDFWELLPEEIKKLDPKRETYNRGCVGVSCLLSKYAAETFDDVAIMMNSCYETEEEAIAKSKKLKCKCDERPQIIGVRYSQKVDGVPEKFAGGPKKGAYRFPVNNIINAQKRANTNGGIPYDFGWRTDDGYYIHANNAANSSNPMKVIISSKDEFNGDNASHGWKTMYCTFCRKTHKGKNGDY